MKIQIANPIYDSVFKYLMEDKRIAKTILSALLKKDIIEIEMRPHEYTNQTRDTISMFRIDFSAKVREVDESEHPILIELQKTWLETETLRFRQYLGAQYNDKRNIQENSGYAIPMITVYLLGHRVGDIEAPIIYVDHKAYDYDNRELHKGIPDPFIESLVHNSVIVQIPLLHGKINSTLDKVLCVFDQTKTDTENNHLINIDKSEYGNSDDMAYIIRKLKKAAANAKIRQDMNVEDEYFQALEDRDTAIMKRDKKISEQGKKLNKQENTISEQSNTISEQSKMLHLTATGLKEKGWTIEQISALTGLSADCLKDLFNK